ncbi:MAG: hypothetical protein Q3Y17_20165 [Blautia sp.]|nr:hypothetical protein [Blautia sp.]
MTRKRKNKVIAAQGCAAFQLQSPVQKKREETAHMAVWEVPVTERQAVNRG